MKYRNKKTGEIVEVSHKQISSLYMSGKKKFTIFLKDKRGMPEEYFNENYEEII
jgi:hypothetical protein